MTTYTPYHVCPHCRSVVEARLTDHTTHGGLHSGYQAVCGCDESRAAWEADHRAEMERRKRTRRR